MKEIITQLYNELKKSVSVCRSDNLALSGGLDSSIIAYFLKKKKLNTVTIIAEDFLASDLTYCQLVSKQLGIELEIKNIKTSDLLEALKETICILKNFNDIEIRNSVVMYMAIKSVKENGGDMLITGDGADELFAGYNFFLNKSYKDMDMEQKRISNIMHFPSYVIGQHLGVKIESPFLEQNIKDIAKNIPIEYKVRQQNGVTHGKWILRKAFEEQLPRQVIWRKKSAMQDGAGTCGLTGLFESVISDKIFEEETKKILHTDKVILRTKESLHYYKIYKKYYDLPKNSNLGNTCPYCKTLIVNSKFCRMCGAYPI